MNKLIMVLALLLGSDAGFANASRVINDNSYSPTQGSSLLVDNDMVGQNGVHFFGSILKNSSLYNFLLSLDDSVPQMAKQLEYVALLNEVHLANQTLSQILVALQKNNHLLEHFAQRGGAMNG